MKVVLVLVGLACLAQCRGVAQGTGTLVWQIGKADRDDREFALAPNRFSEFGADGFFVIGRSDSRRDWPYAHPGPNDGWAGSRQHTFAIVFGLGAAPAEGECRLQFALIDSQRDFPPELGIRVNDREFRHKIRPGAGDDSINGQPARGKPYSFGLTFPAQALRAGVNTVALTTLSGSWMLYDWVGLYGPAGIQVVPATGTALSSVTAPPILVERGGKLMQVLRLAVQHFGGQATATARLDSADIGKLVLQPAARVFELAVPPVERERSAVVSLEIAGQAVGRATITLRPVRKWIVWLLPHSHTDIGYTDVQTNVERAHWRYLEQGIEAARKSADYPPGSRFKWNVEVLWPLEGYLKQATRERRQDFFHAVKAGWVGLDALYGNELTGLCRPEELLRLTDYATRLSKSAGVPIESAMISDVCGYTWGLVPAFAQSGVKYFSVGPNGGDRAGRINQAWANKAFWWTGPSGRDKLLVWVTGTSYGTIFQSPQSLLDHLSNLDASGYPYDMVQVRHTWCDNTGPDLTLADRVKQWNQTYAYPKVLIATTAEMFRAFEKRYGPKLPELSGDITPYWEDGAASSARETALNRAAAERLTQAETLFAMLNPKAYPAGVFYQAWRNILLYDEHTWGAGNSISEPDAPNVKSQWAIKQAFALEADRQSRELFASALAGRRADGRVIRAVDVLNTTSWPRTDLVELPKELDLAGDVVTDSEGKPVASQRLSTGNLVFVAREVPGFGCRRYAFAPDKLHAEGSARAENLTLRTSALRLRLDPRTGAIASLRSRQVDSDLADSQGPTALNDYFYLAGNDLKALARNGPVNIAVKEAGPILVSLRVESDAPGCRHLTREVRVVEGLDRVDLVNVLDKEPVRLKEGVHFGFGFNVPAGVMRTDMPWSVVRPETDQLPGACRNWLAVQRWVDISNERYGVAWVTVDAPMVEVGGITATLLGSIWDANAWLDHLGPSQTLYSYVMNNHWHTNYRADQEGTTVFRYSIWPHGAFAADATARFAIACSQPLVAVPAAPAPIEGPALIVEPPGVLVTCFKPSEDNEGWIVRLFGAAGRADNAKLTWRGSPPAKIWLSNATEKPLAKAGQPIEVPPYGIVTLRVAVSPSRSTR